MSAFLNNILFTTDLSENSVYAFNHAVGLAHATGASLQVLHVAEPISEDARITIQMFVQDESIRKTALQSRLEQVKSKLHSAQESYWSTAPEEFQSVRSQVKSTEVIEGHPAEVILRKSRELKCDLIVLGAHSHGFTQTFLGTTAKRILRRATIPTVVVPYTG